MEKYEIIDSLKEKYDDEFTIKVFSNFVKEFDICFGQYISTEEIIKRLKKRIDSNIEIVDEYINGKLDGRYDFNRSKIVLHKNILENEELCKYLAFHELTHVISIKEMEDGSIIKGFIDDKSGIGLDEAMTEYLTQLRNKKLGQKGESGYKTIVEQNKHLMQIIGKDKLINCFLYEPEKLEELINNNNMDYKQIKEAFSRFCENDFDVYYLGNKKKIDEMRNYNLYKQAQILLDNFSRGMGDVDTLEKFEKKYSILNDYENEKYNINNIMKFSYYQKMHNDIVRLMHNGVSLQDISPILSKLDISANEFNLNNSFSDKLTGDKNQIAILLYNYYKDKPQDYMNFSVQNYSLLYDIFSETDLLPNENVLYDFERYPLIGKFLSEYKNYLYDEISTEKINDDKNCSFYFFTTEDRERYLYTFLDYPVEQIEKDKFRCIMQDEEVTFDLSQENKFCYEFKGKELRTYSSEYYNYSQLSDLEYCIDLKETSPERKELYSKRAKKIREQILENRTMADDTTIDSPRQAFLNQIKQENINSEKNLSDETKKNNHKQII